ncbi:flagellar filament capping protein FliD [Advenella alkanexedens]|uniref:flagellar filament capping protein FliD n=1 Tax=Advenella alkanexedens TaxID=1481665 RepID=UPI002675082B|nr:flagellar filament capping protein FliD [Advenella alkanexedens]WKU18163.1 flagellar filament capping protein FliD [Advenella alkanexedens]
MANISSIGVGSGLDLSTLLDGFRTSEESVLSTITQRKSTENARLSAYGQLSSAIEKLQTAAKAFEGDTTFGQYATSQTGESFSASASSSAVAGSYRIHVTSLASTQTLIANGVADKTAQNGTGGKVSFTLKNGDIKELNLEGKSTSIQDIAAAINADSELGISASIMNDGSGSPYRLMLSTTATGTEAAISNITVEDNDGNLGTLLNKSAMQEQAASDAVIKVNGIEVTQATNKLENVIQGVTLNLSKVDTEAQTLTVTRNDDKAKAAINEFITAYNNVQKFIKSSTAYTEGAGGSVLNGDSTARTAQTRLSGIMNFQSSNGGAFKTLSDLGIRTQADGSIQLDEEKFGKALTENRDDIAKLFQDKTNGIATYTQNVTKSLISSTTGIVTTASNGTKTRIEELNSQYERKQAQIEATMERYRAQFTALDSLVAKMNGTSAYLSQQLSMWNTSGSK